MDVLHGKFHVLGQLEEAAGSLQHRLGQLLRHSVAGEVEEPHLVHGLAKFLTEGGGFLRACAEAGEVQDGQ